MNSKVQLKQHHEFESAVVLEQHHELESAVVLEQHHEPESAVVLEQHHELKVQLCWNSTMCRCAGTTQTILRVNTYEGLLLSVCSPGVILCG